MCTESQTEFYQSLSDELFSELKIYSPSEINSAILSDLPVIVKDPKGYAIMLMKGETFGTFISLHQAIVGVLKLFHVLDTSYPPELKNLFGFIDVTLFGFDVSNKERSLVKKIEQFRSKM